MDASLEQYAYNEGVFLKLKSAGAKFDKDSKAGKMSIHEAVDGLNLHVLQQLIYVYKVPVDDSNLDTYGRSINQRLMVSDKFTPQNAQAINDILDVLVYSGIHFKNPLLLYHMLSNYVSNGASLTMATYLAEHMDHGFVLHHALDKGSDIEPLLEAGVDPNKEHNGTLPLITAVKYSDIGTVKLLLEHGANKEQIAGSINAIGMAYSRGNKEIIKLLDPDRKHLRYN